MLMAMALQAQLEPTAGNWKTWFIASAKAWPLPAPAANKAELADVLKRQQQLDAAGRQQLAYWSAGAPGYRWQQLMADNWMSDAHNKGILANMLLSVAIYDATVVAWQGKYQHKRPRPYAVDSRIRALAPKADSPSYPCEHSVAAGVASTVIAHFFPALADSVGRMAQRCMEVRIAAGMAYPSDTKAGFELGKKIAEAEIAHTKGFMATAAWDGKVPEGPAFWKGKHPMLPTGGRSQPVVLSSGNQFRPGPPPDFAKDMAELKNYQQNFMSKANALYHATQSTDDLLHQKVFEYNWHLNPPRAARFYAATAIGYYDGFVACWDAKYAYWGIRPDQYDTSYKPLLPTPPFPGYPSGHAAVSSVTSEICSYFFPAEAAFFGNRAKEVAESRFQGGIHFRTDNEVALVLGRQVGQAIVERLKQDGSDR
jgi:membrane-associated phospholipid phosphatase